jgi:regulator of sirC expression with transglutaminase-like and TPR domain
LAVAYINRGWAYSNLRKWDLAIADYSRAIDLDPNNALLYADRGMAYRGEGKNAEAVADFEKFISLTEDPQLIQMARQLIDQLSE